MQMGSTNFTAAADGVANQVISPSIDVDDHLKFSKTNKDIDLENDKSISSIITYTKNSSMTNLRQDPVKHVNFTQPVWAHDVSEETKRHLESV